MQLLIKKLKTQSGNTVVENAIILPLIIIVIFALILTMFMLHDRSTLESAAKRGTIFAAHCVSDPNYASIRELSGGKAEDMDFAYDISEFVFTEINKNNKPYRYISQSSFMEDEVKNEVYTIVNATCIPWHKIDISDVDVKNDNHLVYQNIIITINASYPLPKFFEVVGLETDYDYSVSAKMNVNEPDEFIRNADMVVDIIVKIDNSTGGHLSSARDKVLSLAGKLSDWLKIK